ncbi:SNF2-related protein [Thermodesulfovibrionales bacterium]|nr:SNF2-related protein [Thermodesulfovibrionales bacterium]
MIFKTPEDTYKAYQRFLKKKEFKRAYRCLEKMLHEFPDDKMLLEEIVDLCVISLENPKLGRPWLNRLAKLRSLWLDYTLLSSAEAELENFTKAREYLQIARRLQKEQSWAISPKKNPKRVFTELEDFIKHREWNVLAKKQSGSSELGVKGEKQQMQIKKSEDRKLRKQKDKNSSLVTHQPPSAKKTDMHIPSYTIPVKILPLNEDKFSPFIKGKRSTLNECQMLIDYMQMTVQSGFDELICLGAIAGIEKYWYQIETVKKVLKHFHGRVLLCDEVGLGKTIEAGMLIKEYLMRGMIKNILILTPVTLVSQWKEEMLSKFQIEFLTIDDIDSQANSDGFWKNRFIIASLNTAKNSRNMPLVIEQFYDLVVVDEAHHLRNRRTLSWKLVNQIKKKLIFLLSATPVQNNLIELFNLITLLKPGQFKTEKLFKQEYVKRGNQRVPVNKEKLRELLRDVMIRNTRSAIDLKLPKRFATTIRVEPTAVESEIYNIISDYLRRHDLKKPMINLLLKEAGSSPFALKNSLLKIGKPFAKEGKGGFEGIIDALDDNKATSKGEALLEILMKNPHEKKIIFTQYIKTMDYITNLLRREKIPYVTFSGNMRVREKDLAIARFKDEIPVLVSTESGGEGRNMQFCNTIINFDLPWNPMKIEQRIGRLHRIGQTRDVFIFNLSVKDTIENYIIDILDSKINMFEMVIGEIEPILGHLGEDKDFEDIIMEIWLKSKDKDTLKHDFELLGDEIVNAKSEYLKSKVLDDEIFGDDYEI